MTQDATGRSELMKRVKRANTAPEMAVRRLLHAMGYRYVVHHPNLPGRPDIVFTRRKKVIFVHGCFWHGHDCKLGRLPKSNVEFWHAKLERNKERDQRVEAELRSDGWDVLVLWQCALVNADCISNTLRNFLGPVAVGRPDSVVGSREQDFVKN
ncbi:MULTISPECIES: very short patch repair endonuclease [unclassified Paraburkholderia]|uniref:very short patch repair endonuclease n=1 Tax=unclassified Paraburkholderia TaxID=2615204 RepID=UPI002AB0D36E|nr:MULTISPECIES: very short patch repair endonuclease [unclassified Paraburkholderia]